MQTIIVIQLQSKSHYTPEAGPFRPEPETGQPPLAFHNSECTSGPVPCSMMHDHSSLWQSQSRVTMRKMYKTILYFRHTCILRKNLVSRSRMALLMASV